mmetsp:Transcript_25302/g.88295  ORF Transcript_25302/g.88295 Transcript_25302/m.88295 type:complete len:243 (-) Transcript_25302:931-1659(-)
MLGDVACADDRLELCDLLLQVTTPTGCAVAVECDVLLQARMQLGDFAARRAALVQLELHELHDDAEQSAQVPNDADDRTAALLAEHVESVVLLCVGDLHNEVEDHLQRGEVLYLGRVARLRRSCGAEAPCRSGSRRNVLLKLAVDIAAATAAAHQLRDLAVRDRPRSGHFLDVGRGRACRFARRLACFVDRREELFARGKRALVAADQALGPVHQLTDGVDRVLRELEALLNGRRAHAAQLS